MREFSREVGESIFVGNDIEIKITRIKSNSIQVAISAPRELLVFRGELYEEIKKLKETFPATLIGSNLNEPIH